MKIKLEYPYTEDYSKAYLRINKENRQTVYLIRKGTNKVTNTTAYARYLLAIKIKRYLTENEQADHIDNNKTNDNINNLQILSREEHKLKTAKELKRSKIIKICEWCNKEFELRRPNANTKTCSRRCGGKLSHLS